MTMKSTADRRRTRQQTRPLHDRPDLLEQRNKDAQRVHTIEVLHRAALKTTDLRIEGPEQGLPRMRRLVHRGTQRPVFKVPSITLGRTVQCESLLEVDAAMLLDADPQVHLYAEQPLRVDYFDGNSWRHHIPDFLVQRGDAPTLVEIKFEKGIDEAVRARTGLLTAKLAEIGVRYSLVTESWIRRDASVQNAMAVLRRARHATTEIQQLAVLEKLRSTGAHALVDFGWGIANSLEAVGIAKLILSGAATVHPDTLISSSSPVRIATTSSEERTPW